jgi:hypothetical protein
MMIALHTLFCREGTPGKVVLIGWFDPRSVLDAIAKKIILSISDENRTSAIQVLTRCTDIEFYFYKVKVKLSN